MKLASGRGELLYAAVSIGNQNLTLGCAIRFYIRWEQIQIQNRQFIQAAELHFMLPQHMRSPIQFSSDR